MEDLAGRLWQQRQTSVAIEREAGYHQEPGVVVLEGALQGERGVPP